MAPWIRVTRDKVAVTNLVNHHHVMVTVGTPLPRQGPLRVAVQSDPVGAVLGRICLKKKKKKKKKKKRKLD